MRLQKETPSGTQVRSRLIRLFILLSILWSLSTQVEVSLFALEPKTLPDTLVTLAISTAWSPHNDYTPFNTRLPDIHEAGGGSMNVFAYSFISSR